MFRVIVLIFIWSDNDFSLNLNLNWRYDDPISIRGAFSIFHNSFVETRCPKISGDSWNMSWFQFTVMILNAANICRNRQILRSIRYMCECHAIHSSGVAHLRRFCFILKFAAGPIGHKHSFLFLPCAFQIYKYFFLLFFRTDTHVRQMCIAK